jgi:ABC-type transport system involved in multi-copper enzyme maturation permease subunit
MTTAARPAEGRQRGSRPGWPRLISAELMKIRTTNVWWLFLIGMVAVTALAFLFNAIGHHYTLQPPVTAVNADQAQQLQRDAAAAHTPAGLAKIAADLMTSGQLFGLLLAMILGILVVTNEFFHQTATTTFLTNPHRAAVITAKAVAALLFGVLLWLVATALDLIATPIFLNSEHVRVSVLEWTVVQSVLLNLAAFAMWAILGLGIGTLIRSQIGAVVTGAVSYLIGAAAIALVFQLIHNVYPHDWVISAEVIAPAIASSIMITPGQAFDHAPPQWAGAVVLVGYTLLAGGLGTWLIRRRDIS